MTTNETGCSFGLENDDDENVLELSSSNVAQFVNILKLIELYTFKCLFFGM